MKTITKYRMYGTHSCSCGCGMPLGNSSVYYSDDDICIGVTDTDDVDGLNDRMFTPHCFNRLKLNELQPEQIYEMYSVPKLID